METGAIVAVTTHGGAAADTATVEETVIEAGVAVAGLVAETTPEGNSPVHPDGVEEVVADKGYHSNDVAVALSDLEVRTKRYMPTGDASGANVANGCSAGAEKRSNATLRTSSTRAAWTGSGCVVWKMSTRNC